MPRRLGKDPEIYNIPAHQSFVDVLAKGVIDRFGDDPISLSKVLILLPNRRAVRSLREAFLRLTEGKATILPNMQPLGDVDEDGLVIGGGGFYDDLDLQPPVPAFLRQSILMDIIASWYVRKDEDIPESANRAQLAEALGHLLDQIQTEELSFDDLKNIVPEEYASHWQQTVEFLKILTEHWPKVLKATGYMDAAARRNLLMKALRESWLRNPPADPIIAAGSTGSIKATSSLLEVIARLPRGMVVLPGLDQSLDDESWDAITDGHPQGMMKTLLDRMRSDRIEVKNWDGSDERTNHHKTILFREIMRPAVTTYRWRELNWNTSEVLENIEQIVAPGIREEAGIIAFKMRAQLEYPGKTAALVTPDRMLARQVSSELKRWDIEVDDSAGTPLFNTPVGTYLRLIAEMAGEKFAPVPLLAALKHPYTAGGIDVGEFRPLVRQFERDYLRGPRPTEGLFGIGDLINKSVEQESFQKWWYQLAKIIKPFENVIISESVPFEEILSAHIKTAEALATTNNEDGAARLWKREDGEAAAQLIEELIEASAQFKVMPGREYPALFNQLMSGVTVRAKYGTHPRLNIWGPLEARLQHADLMILSGLNEGSWPPEYKADPWMSRPMRKDFGLPDLEQKTGLSAHDFVQAASAKYVVITRSEKKDGTPTVKSRWLSRLHAIVGENHHAERSQQWLNWYAMLDKPDHEPKPADPPCPRPPVNARPRELSVTRIQLWMQDPYSLYANKILKLTKLDDLDQDPTAIDKGVMIHQILEKFMTSYKDHLPDNAEEELINIGREHFSSVIDKPTVKAFWWPRFKQIAAWFIKEEMNRREYATTIATETLGEISFSGPAGEFKLSAQADRIDAFKDGGYSVIDYKTGNPPSLRELKAGFAPQLPLEAAITIHNGFHTVKSDKVRELSYWKLSGGEIAGHKTEFSAETRLKSRQVDVPAEAQKAYDGLLKLVATFDLPETPYLNKPRPQSIGYGEYDHLARTKEWGGG